ncbi:MAG: branched-chain amino acid ABC transporter ATP-binding protein/permease [Acidimicrobiaceae bacterium]|nr:branched-chain amino acid ABC transporter ATP-binding protein/permease [Acidimicrobiaceae bacterium]MYG56062.1 branched-chain amino acid ABC transporter ATP-binding protein/permease [Acidimicrobiaceae bacterium]MYK00056.1 branched-chain amino acid ABC transporter ATP-binding protein/permease [Acidimicrobiaceae bacterium]
MFPSLGRDVAFPVVGSVLLFSVFVGAGLIYQNWLGGAAERLVTVMLIDAVIVLGIQIYVGNTGVLSFGHIGFGAIAGYTFAVFAISPEEKAKRIPDAPFGLAEVDVSSTTAVLIAVLLTVAVALIIGVGLARSGAQSGAVSATVITLALLFVTHEVARNWPELTGGERAGLFFPIGGKLDTRVPIYVALFGALVVARVYAQSRSGRLAVAAREDNLAARAMGVNPLVQQMAALLISVAVVSVGASLRVYEDGSLLPDNFFFNYTLLTLVMLIVGGRNSVTGALLGVAVMTAGRELARRLGQDGFEIFGIGLDGEPLDWVFRENLQTVFLGVSMLGFMILRPSGLLGDWEFDEWLRSRFRRSRVGRKAQAAETETKPDPLPELESVEPSVLEAQGIDVSFGGFKALSNVGLVARSGEVIGIIGPNGAGKTTMVNVITGLVEPSSGKFSLNGEDVTSTPTHRLARLGVVRTFQNLRLFAALTVRENVEVSALIAADHRQGRTLIDVDSVIAEASLWEYRDRRARELDYGNSRRLELARAAALTPSFLLLDEPTSGMSDLESTEMIEQVRHMAATIGAGVLVIDHDLNFITGISDRIYVFDHGEVIAHGSAEEVQADPLVRVAYLGTEGTT